MRHRLAAVMILALAGAAACGGGNHGASSSAPPASAAAQPPAAAASTAPAPRCHSVPRTTIRLIASRGNPKTRFAAGTAAAVHVRSGYAVSLRAFAGGTQRMATWYVDRLRAPETVTSGNVEALQITNWPLDSLGAEPVRQSQLCAAKLRPGAGPIAP